MPTAQFRKQVHPEGSPRGGQALVVILLIMAVVLTIGLAVVSRSVTDIRISRQTEESTRAFSAAEAGIEAALLGEAGGPTRDIGEATYTLTVQDYASGVTEFVFPDTAAGEAITVWFVGHEADGSPDLDCSLGGCFGGDEARFCWGTTGGTEPSLEVSFVYDRSGSYEVARVGYDPALNPGRTPGFTTVSGGGKIGGLDFASCGTVDFSDLISSFGSTQLLFGQAKLLFNDQPHRVGVEGEGGPLPAQGKTITSLGQSGEATRRIEVFQGFAEPPPIFGYSLYSGSDLSK